MQKLVIHAGFPKAGSTTIQGALRRNAERLLDQSIYLFGPDLEISFDKIWRGIPSWTLESMRSKGGIAEKIQDQLSRIDEGLAVLSAENLGSERFPCFFEGLDKSIDIEIIFYFRPYHTSLPSCWQQWGTKEGVPLEKYLKRSFDTGWPNYLIVLERWKESLPNAAITVVPFTKNAMIEGNPASDFFSRIGVSGAHEAYAHSNGSYDYSLIDLVCSESSQLFFEKGVHPSSRLRPLIPEKYRQTNASLISVEWEKRIEARFRDETIEILERFCAVDDPLRFYRDNFSLGARRGGSYIEMDSKEVLARAFNILLESFGEKRMRHALGSLLLECLQEEKKKKGGG